MSDYTKLLQALRTTNWQAPLYTTKCSCEAYQKRIAELEAAQRVPSGWQLVPIEPTEKMVDAICTLKLERIRKFATEAREGKGVAVGAREEYKAWLTAAPTPKENNNG